MLRKMETHMLKGLWKTSGHYLTFHQKIKRRNAEDQSKEILDWSRFRIFKRLKESY